MGGATFSIGLMPTFASTGWFSPIMLIVIRVLQGLALGGEYGGAAVYVAEHVPDSKRGLYTSIIQVTAILGLLISLLIILVTQFAMPRAAFDEWGWRIPFLVSFFLVGISIYIRLKLRESPIFVRLKTSGKTSLQPLTDAFTKWPNLKQVLLCLFGLTAGQGVVAYTGEFYTLFYMQTILKVNPHTATIVMAIVLALSLPVMMFFGILSDKISRKWIMLAGCLLAVLTYIPIYHAMQSAAGNHVVTVKSRRNPVTGAINLTPLTTDANGALVAAPEAPHPDLIKLVILIFIQMIYVSMVYGPVAAYLVEAFPANIRYTSLSLPYHIGNGIFGGLLPVVGLSICAATGKIYAGLYYPMAVAALTFIVGSIALRETHGNSIWEEVESP
jgi:MFS family permease